MIKKVLFFLILACPTALILSSIGKFAFPPGSPYSDLAISHLPNALFINHTVTIWHQIPLWSDQILSGYPFAADPLSSLWYLPAWLAVAWPGPVTFNLLIAFHIMFGGIGLYFFLRSENRGEVSALLGAFIFELMPKIFAHYASGHVTLIYAVMWTPWLIWMERKANTTGRLRFRCLTAVILGMIVLADVRWAAYAAVLWFCYSFTLWRTFPSHSTFWGWIKWVIGEGFIALLLSAPLLLPLSEYTRLSTRSLLQPADNLMLSLAPAQLLGLIIPQLWGYAEYIIYPGILPFLLTVFVLCIPTIRRKSAFWIGVLVVTLVFSLGGNLPGASWVSYLPGFSLLRVPTRWLFVAFLSISILTAYGADGLSPGFIFRKNAKPNPAIFFVALSAFVVFLSIGLQVISKNIPLPFLWSAILIPTISVLILLRAQAKIPDRWWLPIIFGLALFDMGSISLSQVDFRNATQVMMAQERIGTYLSQQDKPFRVYSPSYSLPQQVGAALDIEQADGINPLQLMAYADFMEKASGIPAEGYSVTLPPFSSANPLIDNQAYTPDATTLGLLNVRYVLSEYDLDSTDLFLTTRIDQTRIYENKLVRPRAWVQSADTPIGEKLISLPTPVISPNEVALTAQGPGVLVLSEINYPGWVARIDGLKTDIIPVAKVLRAINLPEGKHTVTFSFEPAILWAGIGLAAVTWLGLISLALVGKR